MNTPSQSDPENGAIRLVRTSTLSLAYEGHGPTDGWPVVLLHGFPYDPRAFDQVVPILEQRGAHVVVPYLRGFGPTRFLAPDTPRSAQQAALGRDVLELLDALALPRAILAGFDWGNRAACVAAALDPARVQALVSVGGYPILGLPAGLQPLAPDRECIRWYQFYFCTERGRVGLARNRRALCELLWRQWSPGWDFAPASFERTAASFDNPDFVDVVVHGYRHRLGQAAGDPAYEQDERVLAPQPAIRCPVIVLEGDANGAAGPPSQSAPGRFMGPHGHRAVAGAGHNVPAEQPRAFAQAVLDLQESLQGTR